METVVEDRFSSLDAYVLHLATEQADDHCPDDVEAFLRAAAEIGEREADQLGEPFERARERHHRLADLEFRQVGSWIVLVAGVILMAPLLAAGLVAPETAFG